MSRLWWLVFSFSLFAGSQRVYANENLPPDFVSPYASDQPLESFLVFSAPPRANVPDGQIHWVDAEVPGIDVRGLDGALLSMCAGQAWSLTAGDQVGGGGNFIAVECGADWQMLAFHLCAVEIPQTLDPAQRVFTAVQAGTRLGRECDHTHLSLGYYARTDQKRDLPCPQWYVQGRYWVNAICLAKTHTLPKTLTLPLYLIPTNDWELQLLQPDVLQPLRDGSAFVLMTGLGLYLLIAVFRPAKPSVDNARNPSPPTSAVLKSLICVGIVVVMVMVSAGPVWPLSGYGGYMVYSADAPKYQTIAQETGFSDWRLLQAFYLVAVPRDAQGRPAADPATGKIFPPEAAAAIPFGETNAEDWGTVDPTQPGPYGQYRAWEAVVERWPVNTYESTVLGLSVSVFAQQQRDGLSALARSPTMQQLGRQLGKTIQPEDLYGSSAGAVGRTQILPSYFAPGALCGDLTSMDVWNDPLAVAECTTRYLTISGCRGSWWQTGDVWSALCGYNPGAWNVAEHQWYWDVLQDRMTRLTTAAAQHGLIEPGLSADSARLLDTRLLTEVVRPAYDPMLTLGRDRLVSTPVLGLVFAEAVLQNGQTGYKLPARLNEWAATLSPQTTIQHDQVRNWYRLFRAWVMVFYTPQQRLELGLNF